ncbi:unnamed protein product [Peronospora belbahrii]|uniref:histone acetyltransferase n=1 Tax=Peronospora belbahrii TaxID=622444 RepID=A0ABN8D9G1_9STRA|nr:unnamed protein product [Peronospora belbahrii]
MTPSGGIKRSRDEKDETSIVKRVRFAHSVSSTSSIYLSIVEAQKLKWFGPTFTYHTFGIDEVINGYKELNIFVTFNGFDFQALLDVKYKEKEDTADDVVSKMLSSLPHDVYLSKDEFAVALSKAAADFTCPPGNCIETYATETVIQDGEEQLADKRYFEIYECKLDGNEPAQKLLANLQTLSLWFIEGADAVDVTDPRWSSWTKGCRQGHAERLVHCIHAQAMSNSGVYELTVEDPVPGFSCLRDLVDLKNCVKHDFFCLAPEQSTDAGGTGRDVL